MPQQHEQGPALKRQVSSVRTDLILRGAHMGLPWAVFLALTAFGNVMRLLSVHDPAFGRWLWLTTGLTVLAGAGGAAWDRHLRRHRMSAAGRLAGPVTIGAVTVMTAVFLNAGYQVPLVLTWMIGGIAGCTGWDGWLHHAAAHEVTLGFAASAQAAGLGSASLVVRERPRAPRRAGAVQPMRGSIVHPGGEVTQADVAARTANLEGARRYPPGAFSVTPSADDSAVTDFIVSDPRVLEHSDPWPGPHAPGAGMGVPFRMGTWQTGEVALVPRLPGFHTRGMGMSGSAKTLGWHYNLLGEGVTRREYAALVIDVSKGEQFFGPWRPALHRFETAEEKALYLLRGIHRARRARTDYLGRKHMTEWAEGCGLSWVDIVLAECPDVIRLLETAKSRMANAVMSLDDWNSDVKNGRSAGYSWNLDLQLTLASEMPTVAQGQMSHLCLGVEDRAQAAFGLSARQKDAGCRPELWGKKKPGMAYWDVPTLGDEYATVPMRFFEWPGGARQAFEYAAQWPAGARPLDDVTGEALEAEPAPPASHGLPGPGGTLPGEVRRGPGRPRKDGSNVRPLFGFPGRAVRQPGAAPEREAGAEAAEETVRRHLAQKYAKGEKVFAFNDLTKEGLWGGVGEGKGGTTNRARSWGYNAMRSMTALGYLEEAPGARQRWRILPAVLQQEQDEEG
jgi:hypothetical protein